MCRGTGKRTFEICFQQIFVARENDVRFGMDRRAENGSVVYVAHLFFGSIGGFWNGYDFQHQHGHGEEGFERLNFMREFPVKCSSQFFYVLPADDACIRRRDRFDVCLKGRTARVECSRKEEVGINQYSHRKNPHPESLL